MDTMEVENHEQYRQKVIKLDDDDENHEDNIITIVESSDLQLEGRSRITRSNIVMAKYLYKSTQYHSSQNVLELQSGTGIVSIFMAKLGHRVLATDNQKIIKLVNRNIKKNKVEQMATGCALEHIQDIEPILDSFGNLDMIVGCELFQNYQQIETTMKQIKSICNLMKQKNKFKQSEVLLAVRIDNEEEEEWNVKQIINRMEENGFEVDEVGGDELHEMYRDRYIRILCLQYLDT